MTWVREGSLRVVIGGAWVVVGGGYAPVAVGPNFDLGPRTLTLPEPVNTLTLDRVNTLTLDRVNTLTILEDTNGGN